MRVIHPPPLLSLAVQWSVALFPPPSLPPPPNSHYVLLTATNQKLEAGMALGTRVVEWTVDDGKLGEGLEIQRASY